MFGGGLEIEPFPIAIASLPVKMARLKVAAIGSSFAAGPSIEPIIDKSAMRSGRNYAHQLAEKLNADLTDLTVSGATLLNVLNEPQQARSGDVFAPQLEGLTSDTDIVTLTGGGNDLGYSFGMIQDSMMSYTGPLRYLLQRWIEHPTTAVDLQQLTDRFVTVIDKVHELAPKSKVYLVQYLSVFGEFSKPGAGIPLAWHEIGYYRRRGVLLDQAYEQAAEARSEFVELVPVASLSEGHEVGTMEPWMEGFSWGMLLRGIVPYHPNLAGHTAVAEALYRQMQKSQQVQG